METLFRTVVGSRLYNLHHADSDYDYLTVVTKRAGTTSHTRKRYAKQTIVDGLDSIVVDFGTFVEGCKSGVPQYCEAMMSQQAEIDLITPYRQNFILTTDSWARYLRTIKSFAYSETDVVKRKRHALRLANNLRDIMHTGRFNPALAEWKVTLYTALAEECSPDEVYNYCMGYVWS